MTQPNPQSIIPNIPRESILVDKQGNITHSWKLFLDQLTTALQTNYKPEGLFIPSQTTANINLLTGQPSYNNIIFDSTANLFKGNINGTWYPFSAGVSIVNSVTGTTDRITVSPNIGNVVVDIAATYIGQTSITTLGTIGTGIWNGSIIGLTYGGTNASLSANNGGIVYSNSTQLQILSGTATASKMLLSGSTTTPSWSVSTIPTSAGATANKVLLSDGTNYVLSTPTFPNASATSGKIIISDGTNWVTTTTTYPSTNSINTIMYASSANILGVISASNNGVLISGTTGIPSWLAAGTTGQVLVATTSNPATWSALSGIAVTTAQGTSPIQVNGASSTPVSGAITISVTNATTSNVGVASFNATNFSVSGGGAVTSQNFTVNAGTGLSGGGSLTLGGSVSLSNSGVLSVSGTTNRIAVSPTTGNVVVDIDSAYAGQTSIVNLGTVLFGTWNATVITGQYGGTGVANTGLTIDLSGGATTKILKSDSSGNGTWQVASTFTVASAQGTSNQVLANATSGSPQTGAITFTTPQDIGTSSNVQFGSIAINGSLTSGSVATFNSTNSYNTIIKGTQISVDGSSNQIGFYNNPTLNPTNGGNILYGIYNNPVFFVPTGKTIASSYGLSIAPNYSSNLGTISNAVTLHLQAGSAATGSVVNNFTFYCSSPTSGSQKYTAYFDAGVGIGDFNDVTSSAILLLSSTTQGFLPPSMSTTEKNSISSPASGLVVYDNILNDIQYYNGSSWISSAGVISVSGTTNRITVSPTTGNAVVDISASYVGQSSITTLGTLTTGTWNATAINLSSYASGTLQAAQFPALLSDVTTSAGSLTTTIKSSVNLSGNPTTTTQSSSDNSTRISTTAYVTTAISNAIAAVNPAVAVQAATTAASDTSSFTYNNGVSGVGATLTGPINTAFTVDGYTFTALNQRVLVKNDTQSPSGAFNGVYYVTQIQTVLLPVILTRALDYNQPSDINNTGAIPVVNGTVNALTSWLLTSSVATVGTDPLTYSQFSYNPSSIVTTVQGTSNQINPTSATSGAVTLSLSSSIVTPGTLAVTGSLTSGSTTTLTSTTAYNTNITGTQTTQTGNNEICLYLNPTLAPAAQITGGVAAIYNTPTITVPNVTNNAITNAYGQYTLLTVNGTAGKNIGTSYGLYVDNTTLSTATISASFGGFFKAQTAGTSNNFALYADNLTVGSITNNPPASGALISGPLTVGSSSDANSKVTCVVGSSYGVTFIGTHTAQTGNNQIGINFSATGGFSPAAQITGYCAAIAILSTFKGANTTNPVIASIYGVYINPSFQDAAPAGKTITNYRGLFVGAGTLLDATTVTNTYGGYFTAPGFGTNKVALYADNLAIGTTNTAPPASGMFCTGNAAFGATSVFPNSSFSFTATTASNMYLTGTQTALISGITQACLYISPSLNPTNGSAGNTMGIACTPTFISPNAQTISNAMGIYVLNSLSSNIGTITNSYGIYIDNGSIAGTVTNNYGIRIIQPSAGTNKYTAYFDAGIGIGAVNLSTSTAALSITSTTQGFLPPVMTTTQRNAISSPASGLSVYDSTMNDTYFYNGTYWRGSQFPPVADAWTVNYCGGL